ncbi:hypothetical protein CERZMDRAFT_40828 [Cercospora zeae-maydis SCOH1-5]|uniref:Uncharacterized protein n=1 Tax=Cercospora zeae-maydis SCOH1-5 TaxID=717836 RepID=A0A6A6FHI9_9PEZI|nr:hypothetical protein CERZMDRAFT_40828 [Cercospora zeae-maydis SCOH1-5]
MGLFDSASGGKSYYTSSTEAFLKPNASHTSSRRGVSPARSTRSVKTSSGGGGYQVRPSASTSHSRPSYARSASGSIFGNSGGGGGGGGGSGSSSSSYYKRRPRDGYIAYLVHKLQRMIKELWHYARRHPVKAFFAVVVPLLSAGGAIGGLLKHFGIRMPLGMGSGGGGSSRGPGGYYGSRGYGGDEGGWMSALGGSAGLMGNAGSLISVAKMFM